jgi:hypothetical protein
MNAAPVFWYLVPAVSASRMDGYGMGCIIMRSTGFFFAFPSQSPFHKVRTVLIDGDQRFQRESTASWQEYSIPISP